jgi:hypothetical protein
VGLILAGWTLAIVPNVVALTAWVFASGWSIPGAEYFPLLLVAIPASMALAVRREEGTAAAAIAES